MVMNVSEVDVVTEDKGSASALSWSAIIGGALAAAGVTLILVALGAGLGFASISPWSRPSSAATTFGVMTAIWFVVVQWLASAFGGYLAGCGQNGSAYTGMKAPSAIPPMACWPGRWRRHWSLCC
jgi:hypothetical protein